MTANETILAARKLSSESPSLAKAMTASWNAILDQVEPWALAKRPKLKSFEVHHILETLKVTFLEGVVASADAAQAEQDTLAKLSRMT